MENIHDLQDVVLHKIAELPDEAGGCVLITTTRDIDCSASFLKLSITEICKCIAGGLITVTDSQYPNDPVLQLKAVNEMIGRIHKIALENINDRDDEQNNQ